MRKITFVLAATMMYITSCSTGKYTASREYDDVYYSKADKVNKPVQVSSEPVQQNNTTNPDDYTSNQNSERRESIGNDESGNQRFDYNTQNYNSVNQQQPDYTSTQQQGGNTYVTNNYYDNDDYYDYAYSSRLRRFYHPCGWGYYDTYYTNSYWYDYNPYSWGVSIYLGYNWWQPHHIWAPSLGITIGNGYPGYNAYDPFYNPYYGGFGYGAGYNQGYQNGYINGYYNGLYNGSFNPYYYNSYDSYSYYYGPRGKGSSLNSTGGPRNISQIYANNANGLANSQPANQAASAEQPFIKIKNNTQPIRQITNEGPNGIDVKNPKGNSSESQYNTGGVKTQPNVKSNEGVPVKNIKDSKEGVINENPDPIKVPHDIKGNQNNNNVEGDPIKNPSDIKVKGNVPVKSNPEIRNENEINPGNDIRNIKSNPSDGIIKNPNQNTPIRNNPNEHTPVQPGNNPNGNIRTPRGEQPIRQNNSNENTPVKSPRMNDGSVNDRSPSEQPVKSQPQYNNDQRNNKKLNEGQKPRSERVREKVRAQENTNPGGNSNPSRNERTVNQQQSPSMSQPRQSEQRNSNSNGNKIESRPRR